MVRTGKGSRFVAGSNNTTTPSSLRDQRADQDTDPAWVSQLDRASGLLDADDAGDMLGWDNDGFSLDARVRIAGHDRAGLERLEQVNPHQVIYHLPKPRRDGRTTFSLTEASPVQRILTHIGEPAEPPPLAPARGPPAWDGLVDAVPDWDALAQPEPEYLFHQQAQW